MIDILLNAGAAGGLAVLLWYLSYPLSKKHFKASWHYAVLKIAAVFMAAPVSIFASAFNSIAVKVNTQHVPELPPVISIDAETINSVNSALSDFVFPSVPYSPPLRDGDTAVTGTAKSAAPDIPYLQIIWLIVAGVIFFCGAGKVHRFRKRIAAASCVIADREALEIFLKCKRCIGVRGTVSLRTSKYIKMPFVFGLIHPTVIFPETDMSADEIRIAFIHELTHIKNGDLWWKFIAFIISAVHWFNPFAHLLRCKISEVNEEYCDERIARTMTKEEILAYGNLILKIASDTTTPQVKFYSALSAPIKNLKRRLINMMNTKKSPKGIIVLSVIAAFIICSSAVIYAFAANISAPENPAPAAEENSDTDTEKADVLEESPDTESIVSSMGFNGEMYAIKWLTYDEFKAWIDKKKAELQRVPIAWYESALEKLRYGVVDVAMITVENIEHIYVFSDSERIRYNDLCYDIEWLTYDEFKAWIDKNKSELQDEQITWYAWYESALEDLKNDVYKAGIINVDNTERLIIQTYFTDISNLPPQNN